jgi:hypothetical protein
VPQAISADRVGNVFNNITRSMDGKPDVSRFEEEHNGLYR